MKNILIILTALAFLSGCFGSEKFDATDELSIKESSQKVAESLPEDKREEFLKAIVYYSLGGVEGIQYMIGAAFSGNLSLATETMFYINLKAIHGLNGEQILKKYRKDLKDNTLKHEKQSAEQDAIHKLNDEAEVLLKNNKFEEALAKYTLMSEMPSGVEPAKLGVAKTTKAMKNFNEKMNYFDKIEITEFVAQRVNTYSKNDIPSVRFSLKNRGSRSLDMVKVTVYFRDRQGNIIFEKDFHPVLVSKYSFGDNKPLKPGYVKEIEKDKFYTIDSQLSEWFEGSAFAKITDLKFTE